VLTSVEKATIASPLSRFGAEVKHLLALMAKALAHLADLLCIDLSVSA
jgi:hypothetical protein